MGLFNYLGAFILASEIPFTNDSRPSKWNLLVDVAVIAEGIFRSASVFCIFEAPRSEQLFKSFLQTDIPF